MSMETEPFDQLGAGQVGRLVYQIIGKNGPIFNPRNIRYLSPIDAEKQGLIQHPSTTTDLGGLAAGIAGVNLIASMANVALSAAILKEVKRISSRLDEVRQMSVQILDRLQWMSEKLNIIDTKVSENNLRHALRHVARTCIVENSIDLHKIGELEGDITNFLTSVEGYAYGSEAFFRLSLDIRDQLTTLHTFLFSVRETVARNHNLRAHGEPSNALTMNPVRDYAPDADNGYRVTSLAVLKTENDLLRLEEDVAATMNKRFRFSRRDDEQAFREIVKSARDEILCRYEEIDGVAYRMGRRLASLVNEATNRDTMMEMVGEWEAYWLLRTDMGLLYRVKKELAALEDYKVSFPHWARVETKPLGSDQLLIDCRWKR